MLDPLYRPNKCVTKKQFSNFQMQAKTYVVGTLKNRLNEMNLLSTQSIG